MPTLNSKSVVIDRAGQTIVAPNLAVDCNTHYSVSEIQSVQTRIMTIVVLRQRQEVEFEEIKMNEKPYILEFLE